MMKPRIFIFINTVILSGLLFSAQNIELQAASLEEMLKGDFTRQETVKIRFEVNKRLFSFEAGKFKLERIKKNRQKIRAITDKIVPWAIMEHLEPTEVARIIVYMYHADQAGASFLDSEDLIPLVAKMDIPIKEFVLMVQYNRETKAAGIPEVIRHAFLGTAVRKGWDGVSILAGGRGLVLARLAGLNINKVGSLLIKRIPRKGASAGSGKLASIVEGVIGKSARKRAANKIMKNLTNTHNSVKAQENSPAGVRNIMKDASRAESDIKKAMATRIPKRPVANRTIDSEPGIVPETPVGPPKKGWQVLSQNILISAVKPWLGTPYKFGAKTGRNGIDCSGFTRNVLIDNRVGVPAAVVGHGTVNQRRAGRKVSKKSLMPGDLVFFSASPRRSKITHVGLMITPSIFSHASSSRGVVYDKLNKKWWRTRYVMGRRVFRDIVN